MCLYVCVCVGDDGDDGDVDDVSVRDASAVNLGKW